MACFAALLLLAARLVINEIMIRPLTGGSEWVEILNAGDAAAPLAGLSIEDARGRPARLPASTDSLPPGAFLVLAAHRDRLLAEWTELDLSRLLEPDGTWPTLNDSPGDDGYADIVALRDGQGARLDSLAYEADWLGESGRSMERLDPGGSSTLAANWGPCEAAARATPLAVNSLALQPGESDQGELIVPRGPVVPGPGGGSSVIGWRLPEPGTLSLEVLDLSGRAVRLLRPLDEAPTIGHLQWDGRDNDGRLCPPGLYVVLLEGRPGARLAPRRWMKPLILAAAD